MAQDALVGVWQGEAPLNPEMPLNGADSSDVEYLGTIGRVRLMDAELAPLFWVSGDVGRATVHSTDGPLLQINRPSTAFFKDQMPWVRAYSDLRIDRIGEINVQIDDLMSFYGGIHYLSGARRKKTLELLYAAYRLTLRLEVTVKHLCRSPRPVDYSGDVQPTIQTPDHSCYPSGHATEAFAIATVLHRLMTGEGPSKGIADRAMPFKMAHRIAANRTIAGVHFPVDSAAGAAMGCAVGEAFTALACGKLADAVPPKAPVFVPVDTNDPQPNTRAPKFVFNAADDFLLSSFDGQYQFPVVKAVPVKKPKTILSRLWAEAAEEN